MRLEAAAVGNLMYNIPLQKDYVVYFQLKVLIQSKRNSYRNRLYCDPASLFISPWEEIYFRLVF